MQAVLKHYSDNRGAVDNAIEETGLLKDNPNLDSALAKVLVTELIFGRGELNGESRPVQTVRLYKERLQQAISGAEYQKKGRCSYIDVSVVQTVLVAVICLLPKDNDQKVEKAISTSCGANKVQHATNQIGS